MLNKDIRSKLYAYATKRLGLRVYRRGWLKGVCPDCGRPDKFGFNIGQNRTNCFVCGYHPSPIRAVMDLEGLVDYNETKKYLKAYEGREYLEPVVERIERIDTVLPEDYHNLLVGSGYISNLARRYVKGRGFDTEEMAYKGWGYVSRGDYLGYLIIPFYIGGKLIYYNARKFMGGGPKYMNPSIEDFGIGKSLIMYNVDALALYEEIYLAEGAINAETLGDQGVATGGKKISAYQISMILKSDVKDVTFLLDPDAIEDAYDVALKMVYHKRVRIVELPEGKDVNDLGNNYVMHRLSNIPFLGYNDLLKQRNEKKT